jgi:hypothetical protein
MRNLNKFRLTKVFWRYTSFLKWFFPDAVGRYKLSIALVIAISAIGVGFQALTFSAIIYYANLLASGNHLVADLHAIQFDLNPRESSALLVVVSVSTLICLSLSAAFVYFARTGNIILGRRYNDYCIERLLDLVARDNQPILETPEGKFVDEKYLRRMMVGDARLCGRFLRITLDMIVPVIKLLFAFGVLLHLNANFTSIIFACMSGYIFFQACVSHNGAKNTKKFEVYTPLVNKILRDLLNQCATSMNHLPRTAQYKPRSYRSVSDRSGAIRSQFNAFDGRLLATEQSRLVSGLFMAIMLGLLFFILGQKIITSGIGWRDLLFYLVALRFAMTSLQLVFGQLTTLNRLYPQIQRYGCFVCAYPVSMHENFQNISQPFTLNIGDTLNIRGDPKLTISLGERIAVLVSFAINKYNYAHLIRQIAEVANIPANQVLANTLFISSNHSLVGNTLRQVFSLTKKDEFSQIDLPDACLDELRANIPSLDAHINSTQWKGVSKKIESLLLLKSVISCPEKLILIDSKLIQELDSRELEFAMEQLNEKVLLIFYENQHSAQIEHFASNVVLISAGDKIIAGGNLAWYRKQKFVIAEHMPKQNPKEVVNRSGESEAEEDYELE